jgi:hypothetical protein
LYCTGEKLDISENDKRRNTPILLMKIIENQIICVNKQPVTSRIQLAVAVFLLWNDLR